MTTSSEENVANKLQVAQNLEPFKLVYTYAKGVDKGIPSLLAEASAGEDLVINNANITSVIEGNKESLCVAYSEDFSHIIAGYTDAAIRKYKINTSELMQTFRDDELEKNPSPVTSIKHKPTSKNYPSADILVATYANGLVKCWNHEFGQCLYTIAEKRQTYGITFHPKLTKFVTFGDDSKLYLYNEETQLQERVFAGSHSPSLLNGHTSKIFACCFHPRNQFELISGGWDNVVFFWDMRQPFAVRNISGVHICGDGIDVNPPGTEILTSAWQTKDPLQLWDYRTEKLLHTISPDAFTSKLYCGKFITTDHAICGGAEPNLLRLVDMKSYTTVGSVNKLPGAVYAIDDCPFRKNKFEKKTTKKLESQEEETVGLPKVLISSCKRLYQIDFS